MIHGCRLKKIPKVLAGGKFLLLKIMKRAKLGLLEVLGLLVRMPGEGDVTALPLAPQGSSGFWRSWW
jgi:hypothetical protein